MKISAINNCRFNNINFEGKKSRNLQTPVHSSTPVKAIPVALLMAMSPINTPVTVAQSSAAQTEYSIPEEDLATKYIFTEAMPDGSAGMITVHRNGEGKDIVELHLKNKIDSYALDQQNNMVDAYRLREIDIIPEKLYSKIETRNSSSGGKKVEAKYYVVGSGKEYTDTPQPFDKAIKLRDDTQPIILDVHSKRYEISKKLYNHLKLMMDGKIEIKEEHSSVFVIEGRRK